MGTVQSNRDLKIDNIEELQLSPHLLKQMKEMELKTKEQHKEDEYWKHRLERLRKTHERTEQIHEINERLAYESYTKNMRVGNGDEKKAPCAARRALVIDCYNTHPRETIHCAGVVRDFLECIQRKKMNVEDEMDENLDLHKDECS